MKTLAKKLAPVCLSLLLLSLCFASCFAQGINCSTVKGGWFSPCRSIRYCVRNGCASKAACSGTCPFASCKGIDAEMNTGAKPTAKPKTNAETKPEATLQVQDVSSYEKQVASLTNAQRQQNGQKALVLDEALCRAARIRAQEIMTSFSHTRPDGRAFSTALQGVSYRFAGENIAKGQSTPVRVMEDWLSSQGHRENILRASYTHLGVACVQDSRGVYHWVQIFAAK